MIGLTLGQQSWLRLLNIDHHQVHARDERRDGAGPRAGERLRRAVQIFGDAIRFGIHSGPQNTTFEDYRDLWLRC